jgi:hypothetical protein
MDLLSGAGFWQETNLKSASIAVKDKMTKNGELLCNSPGHGSRT